MTTNDHPPVPEGAYPDDYVDGCDIDMTKDPTPDDQVDMVTLFCDVLGDPAAVERRAGEWQELFGNASRQ